MCKQPAGGLQNFFYRSPSPTSTPTTAATMFDVPDPFAQATDESNIEDPVTKNSTSTPLDYNSFQSFIESVEVNYLFALILLGVALLSCCSCVLYNQCCARKENQSYLPLRTDDEFGLDGYALNKRTSASVPRYVPRPGMELGRHTRR